MTSSSVAAGSGVILARQVDSAELRRARSAGEVLALRRGAYVRSAEVEPGRRGAEARARATAVAVCAQLGGGVCLSRESAALIWGLPLLQVPSVTHVVQRHRPGSRRDALVHRHVVDLPDSHRTIHRGLPVTTLTRTVADCIAALPGPAGLVVADAALGRGASWTALADLIAGRTGTRGVRRARLVLDRASLGVESPGESLVRWHLIEAGLPIPVVQCPVPTRLGVFRADLGWPAARVALEFDGRVKYSGALGDGVDALVAEKRRQDAMDEAGWVVVRVIWSELSDPAVLARRVRAAFARAERRHHS